MFDVDSLTIHVQRLFILKSPLKSCLFVRPPVFLAKALFIKDLSFSRPHVRPHVTPHLRPHVRPHVEA